MIPRLRRDDDPLPSTDAPVSTDLVDSWLRIFMGLLKAPDAQARAIREELESHLRERARDLMLAGAPEGDAVRQAISELGEAADVAARYRAIRTEPRRRLIMHATLFAAAGAALALSIGAFSSAPRARDAHEARIKAENEALKSIIAGALPAQSTQPAQPPQPGVVHIAADASVAPAASWRRAPDPAPTFQPGSPAPDLADRRFAVSFEGVKLPEALAWLARTVEREPMIHWKPLEEAGFTRDANVMLTAPGQSVSSLLAALTEASDAQEPAALDCRDGDGVLEFATREYFDRRERTLVSYDLSGIVTTRMETYNEARGDIVQEIVGVVTGFVSSDDWVENGGDLARLSVVGDRMFVHAPARFHPQIRWILGQLPDGRKRAQGTALRVLESLRAGAGAEEGQADADGRVLRVYPLSHTSAGEVLNVLRRMRSIRAIDFAPFVVDERTNSILARATPDEHLILQPALDALEMAGEQARKKSDGRRSDSEAAQASLATLSMIRQERVDLETKFQKLQTTAPGGHETVELRERIRNLKQMEAHHRLLLKQLGMNAEQGGGAMEDRHIYLTGSVARPGTYQIPEDGATVRRLLAAAGGLPDEAMEVIVTTSRDGQSEEVVRLSAEDLRKPAGPDPLLLSGQMVSVR